MRVVLIAFLACLPGLALAVGTSLQVPTSVVTATGRATIVPAPLSDFQRLVHQRTRTAAGGGDVTLRDLVARPVGPGVREGDILVTRGVKWDKIARGVSRASAPLLVGGVLLDMWNEAGCRIQGGVIECGSAENLPPIAPNGWILDGMAQVFPTAEAAHIAANQARSAGLLPPLSRSCVRTRIVPDPGQSGWFRFEGVCTDSDPGGWNWPPSTTQFDYSWMGRPNGVATCPGGAPVPSSGCPGGYQPATELQVEERIRDRADRSRAPLAVGALDAAGLPVETDPGRTTVDVPGAIHQDRGTTTLPDGSVIVRDRYNDFVPIPASPGYRPDVPGSGEAPGYSWIPREVTNTYPPGVQPAPPAPTPAPGNPAPPVTQPPGVGPPTIIVNPPPVEIETCGLPGKPPCKIDETGTPTAPGVDTAEATAARDQLTGKIGELATIPAPSWSWAFALPTSCGPIDLGEGFARWGIGQVNICPWQDRFHDLMSMVWAIATVWLSIGMVGSALRGGN